jgi:uncharacterized membrane protein
MFDFFKKIIKTNCDIRILTSNSLQQKRGVNTMKMLSKNAKRGQLNFLNVATFVLAGIVVVILGGIAATILVSIQAGQTANGLAFNITGFGLTMLTNIYNQFGTVGTILGAAVLLGTLALLGVGGYAAYEYAKNR